MELVFEVIKQVKGGYVAACRDERIYTQGQDLEELYSNINEALGEAFQGRPKPDPASVKLMVFQELEEAGAP